MLVESKLLRSNSIRSYRYATSRNARQGDGGRSCGGISYPPIFRISNWRGKPEQIPEFIFVDVSVSCGETSGFAPLTKLRSDLERVGEIDE